MNPQISQINADGSDPQTYIGPNLGNLAQSVDLITVLDTHGVAYSSKSGSRYGEMPPARSDVGGTWE
ncbi:MAG: hypothetical protein HQK56_12585 [Deltaproteobacteria bacterium]|nr:hypothetical protein [Deltaproteobacteria bacterium]